MRLMARN